MSSFKNILSKCKSKDFIMSTSFGTISMTYMYSLKNDKYEEPVGIMIGIVAAAYFGKSTYHLSKLLK